MLVRQGGLTLHLLCELDDEQTMCVDSYLHSFVAPWQQF